MKKDTQELTRLQTRLEDDKGNTELLDQIKEATSQLKANTACLISLTAQRAKMHWIQIGEENSSLFFKQITERRAMNSIVNMKNDVGIIMEEEGEVRLHVLTFFTQLLTNTEGILRDLQLNEGPTNVIPVMDDVRKALFSIGENKAPGPDGFTSCFFKKAWGLVGKDFSEAVIEVFVNGELLKQWNATFINLVPKVVNPTLVKDLRHISCCNTTLKIVTKNTCKQNQRLHL